MKKNVFAYTIAIVIILLLINAKNVSEYNTPYNRDEVELWEKQLNELNFITMRISAINLINGLILTPVQIQRLKVLQQEIDNINISHPPALPDLIPEITLIRDTYLKLTNKLVLKEHLSDTYIDSIFQVRILHSKMIKKTICGKRKIKESPEGCIRCHALPRCFPTGNIDKINTRPIFPLKRKKIDKAHIVGMFGEAGDIKIWELRDEVDKLLTNAQKEIANNYKFCLIPPQDLSDPMRAGQAFSNDRWVSFLTDIRTHDEKSWKKYKRLYLQPLDELIEASMPGITRSNKKSALKKIDIILNETRRMDAIDFDLRKEALCRSLNACFIFDDLTGVSNRPPELQKFVNAMLLLYPGNMEIYNGLQN
ncbi:MAG: hypothetical protein PHT69_14095 [Bacteroidales bacterium]|nr:hypothetical protein [Bacteroidales bacterium]